MAMRSARVIGAGPNGLAAAITLAQAGIDVTVYERAAHVGGAVSTAELTLPGFRHDVGSSVYPLGVASPFFRSLPLESFGLQWLEPDAPLAHPLDDGTAVMLEHDITAMRAQLGEEDGRAWEQLVGPTVRAWPEIVAGVTGPLLSVPRHPLVMARFGVAAMQSGAGLAKKTFRGERARALLAGCAAHSVLPLTEIASAAAGLVLMAAGHATGWPIAKGGAQSLSEALAAYLVSLGGKIVLDHDVRALTDLPDADVTLFDTSIPAATRIAGDRFSRSFQRRLRDFKSGPGIFKVDWALREPIPWRAKDCARAATVHLGGTLEELERSEHAAFHARADAGVHCERPFVLLVQPSLFDVTRAPAGQHTAWAYCHVPHGSSVDMTAILEAQVERFAPGFAECVLARRSWSCAELEAWNPNLVGGDISGGAMTVSQLIARPTLRLYGTSDAAIYFCSSSTPPGGGVHGMCGHLAALAALADHGVQAARA